MHEKFFEEARRIATQAKCYKAKCGSIIVSKDGEIIGRGYNAPPLNDENQRTCNNLYDLSVKPKSDKTCCIHAEWNAIIDAYQTHPDKIKGSTLYFMRVNEEGLFTEAGKPYCTVCSRLALQSGIKKFGLWNNGPDIIDTKEYNRLSYNFYIQKPLQK